MTALICGSLAYDTIMVFPDQFDKHILKDKLSSLNVAFLAPEMRREFGGCAGNIAYNLKMLGENPLIMATVGMDFSPYSTRMRGLGYDQEHIKVIDNQYTAQAFITTDAAENQITTFHPGAMNFSHNNHIEGAQNFSLGIVAPDGRQGMIQHAREFYENGIPYIFDPGQGLPMFSGIEIIDFFATAKYVAANDYEAKMLSEKTGKSMEEIASLVEALIVTNGEYGSAIYTGGECIEIPPVKVNEPIDPTGCGDAYRAGLIFGILNNLEWQKIGKLSSLLGAIKIESQGPQNHIFNLDKIQKSYLDAFNEEF